MIHTGNEETRIDLLRHGEPVGGRRYRGQVDDALSERGWEQMWNAVGTDPEWQQIVSSPLQRCSAFAASLAESLALPVHLEPRFMEVGFGDRASVTGEAPMDEDLMKQYKQLYDESAE